MPTNTQLIRQIMACMKSGSITDGYNLRTTMGETYGFKVLGGGQCSVAMVHPTNDNLVVKAMSRSDDGGVDFAAWVWRQQAMGKHSEYLPRIVEFYEEGGKVVLIMEKLKATGSELGPVGKRPYNHTIDKWRDNNSAGCHVLAQMFEELGGFDDWHDGNWMVRDDGTPVLVDPYWKRRPEKFRWERYYMSGKLHVHAQVLDEEPEQSPLLGTINLDEVEKPVTPPQAPLRFIKGFGHDGKHVPRHLNPHLHKLDLAEAEKRIAQNFRVQAAQLGQIMAADIDKMFLDHIVPRKPIAIGKIQFIPKVDNERPVLVKDGSPAAIRAEKEDRMLRIRSKHDHQSLGKGIQRSLLPGQVARRVQTPRCAQFDGVGEAEGGIAGTTGRATGPPAGLYTGHSGVGKGMAA